MPRPQRPTDLYVTNGWYLELPGLTSPHFETLEGLQKTSEHVDIVDAGTNRKHKFAGQIVDFGDMTLSRTHQGTADDKILIEMAENMIYRGLKVPAVAVKMHHGQEVMRIVLEGFRFSAYTFPTFDVNSQEKFLVNYTATCDNWSVL